jgi:hypothetical protein
MSKFPFQCDHRAMMSRSPGDGCVKSCPVAYSSGFSISYCLGFSSYSVVVTRAC